MNPIPSCPKCSQSVPFSRSLIGRGTPFSCQKCGTHLVVPKAGTLIAIGAFALLSISGKRLLEMPNGGWIIFGIIALGLMLEYVLLPVKVAPPETS